MTPRAMRTKAAPRGWPQNGAKTVTSKTRVHGLYCRMRDRFKTKYWKSGKRQGQMREPGQDLPFSEAELVRCMELAFPLGCAVPCPYCGTAIDALSASLDHAMPITRGGSLGLENLTAICAMCNRLKGALTPSEFKELMQWVLRQEWAAQTDILGRLKAGGMGMRMRYYGKRAL